MASRVRVGALVLALGLALAAWASAPAPLKLVIYPTVSFAPSTLKATITVEPNYLNRAVCLVLDSENYVGDSCWELDGQYAAKTRTYWYKDLPAGEYEIRAVLTQVRDTITSAVSIEVR